MHFLSNLITICHYSHIRSDDSRDASLLGSIYYLMHQGDILTIYDSINCKIALYTMLITSSNHIFQVIDSKR